MYDGQGRKMSHRVNANNYAPKIFAAEKNRITAKRFEQAMERLFEAEPRPDLRPLDERLGAKLEGAE
jgi:hypothetical protein